MSFKIIALTAFLGVCHAADHAYSAQSIVRYDDHKHHHVAVPVISKVTVPVLTKIVPVEHYVSQGSSHGHEDHHATSSQHIHRQDIPAHPPKGFFDNHGHPKYEFEYKVEDPHTGDSKYQHEARDGDVVKGVYSLHEADGSIRTVKYGSDKKTGFTADVKQTTKHQEPKYHHHH